MELVVLGSGTSVPHPARAAAAHWLQTSGGSLLLDCSPAAIHRMAQERLDWINLDAIWISHFHLDHVGGLAPLLFGMKHAPQTQARRKPLVVYGPRGLERLFRAFNEAYDYKLTKQPFPLAFEEVAPGAQFQPLPGLRADTCKTPHTDESLALRLTDTAGAALVFTSDTGPADTLAEFAHGVGLFFMECSFWRDKPVKLHLELAEAMRLAARAAPRRVLLAHLYPQWDGVDLVAEAQKLWPGETLAAYDGLRLNIEAQARQNSA